MIAEAQGSASRPRPCRRPSATAGLGDLSEADMARIVERLEGLLGGGRRRLPRRALRGQLSRTPPATSSTWARGASPRPRQSPGRIPEELARYIDHTILKPDATRDMVDKIVAEAREHGFRSVCVNPCWVKTRGRRPARHAGADLLGGGLSAGRQHARTSRAWRPARRSATAPRKSTWSSTSAASRAATTTTCCKDILAVTEACRDGSAVSKVIIETALLTDEEKVRVCELAKRARANFVKTSTGFASGGATAEDVALMASVVRGAGMEVKASGGIRNFERRQAHDRRRRHAHRRQRQHRHRPGSPAK